MKYGATVLAVVSDRNGVITATVTDQFGSQYSARGRNSMEAAHNAADLMREAGFVVAEILIQYDNRR